MSDEIQPPARSLSGGSSPRDASPEPPRPEPPSLDRYRLVDYVGDGGMGEVWIADQETPVRRRVAVKLIKRGMDSAQVVARFESERQTLALMNHPNIAQVFDAGAA